MTKFQQAVDAVPFLGVGLIALIVSIWLVDAAMAVGWLLRILEIQSVYDRVLPSWTAIHFFVASVVATITVKLIGKGLPD